LLAHFSFSVFLFGFHNENCHPHKTLYFAYYFLQSCHFFKTDATYIRLYTPKQSYPSCRFLFNFSEALGVLAWVTRATL